MKKIITISGDIGSGKSSITKLLKEKLEYKSVGTGAIQREIAQSMGLSTLQLNDLSQTDESIDQQIDSYVVKLGESENCLIVDSRLAWNFIPDSFKIFVSVDPFIGAQRVFSADRLDETHASVDAAYKNNKARRRLETSRFQKIYDINLALKTNYDMVIDSSYSSPEKVVDRIVKCYQARLSNTAMEKIWINPKILYPTQKVRELVDEEYQSVNDSIVKKQCFDLPPVLLFSSDGYYFIWDGHKRIIASEKNSIEFIPGICIGEQPTDKLIDGLSIESFTENLMPTLYYDWEDALGFSFTRYPGRIE